MKITNLSSNVISIGAVSIPSGESRFFIGETIDNPCIYKLLINGLIRVETDIHPKSEPAEKAKRSSGGSKGRKKGS